MCAGESPNTGIAYSCKFELPKREYQMGVEYIFSYENNNERTDVAVAKATSFLRSAPESNV